jgi:hypothetical protein
MQQDDLKRKLRELKHLEEKIRFGGHGRPAGRLVWDRFFDTREKPSGFAKYPLEVLSKLNRDEYKRIIDEFFAYVYFALYEENDITPPQGHYSPELLARLELPPEAGVQEIKKQFRALALKYHPDTGGDAAAFIALMATYRQLMDK